MAEQIRKPKVNRKREEKQVADMPKSSHSAEETKAELDSLLDEIDEVLEENAQEFVSGYIQKGGQ